MTGYCPVRHPIEWVAASFESAKYENCLTETQVTDDDRFTSPRPMLLGDRIGVTYGTKRSDSAQAYACLSSEKILDVGSYQVVRFAPFQVEFSLYAAPLNRTAQHVVGLPGATVSRPSRT